MTVAVDPQLVEQLANLLLDRQWKLATAESCTGGWIAKCCTDLPGSSRWFDRGFVTYSNAAKQEMLGVVDASLESHGAVSETVVREMASGALANSRADLAVAVSGIAGPDGGNDEKPVGTVWFAWASPSGVVSGSKLFEGDRDSVRQQTVLQALQGLIRYAGA